jgi:hypothetical protein
MQLSKNYSEKINDISVLSKIKSVNTQINTTSNGFIDILVRYF